MTAVEPLSQLVGANCFISKDLNMFLEIDLFTRICEEMMELDTFNKMDLDFIIKQKREKNKMEENFVRFIINDILLTEEYNLAGIAYYTNTPEEVIYELATGKNFNPSSNLLRKIMEIHRTVRPELYKEIMHKIIQKNIQS